MNRQLVLIVTISLVALNVAKSQVPQIEKDALIALYNATGGPNWTNNTNWLTTNPVSTWYGITVTNDRVAAIFLGDQNLGVDGDWFEGNNLIGSIPAELGDLSNLTYLNLQWNQINGSIPPELGNLSNLNYLKLSWNQLSGPIPLELYNLTNLTQLLLHSNQLTGSIPLEVANLTNLETLYIGANQFTAGPIPPALFTMLNLKTLYLGISQLTGSIPLELANLSNLEHLDLGGNQLTGPIPPFLGNLLNLESLTLSSNQLTGPIPPILGNLSNLEWLNLENNPFTGSIPAELGNLSNLIGLELFDSQLTGSIPAELGNLSNLTRLTLAYNQLTGSIPAELGNLSNIKWLNIRRNQLSDLPNFMNAVDLEQLYIDENKFEFDDIEPYLWVETFGYYPQNLLSGLPQKDLLTGDQLNITISVGGSANQYQWYKDGFAIPEATTDNLVISNINKFYFGKYHLEVTNTLAPYLTLRSEDVIVTVDLRGGVIEQDYLALVELYNATNGPNWINNTNWLTATNVEDWFGVSVNNFRVSEIILANNALVGTLPLEITDLDGLTNLSVQNNQIDGHIYSDFRNLANAITFNLSHNLLTDSLPPELGEMINLEYVMVNNNKLVGKIPKEILKWKKLQTLDLSSNFFTDIPDVSTFSSLSSFRITDNKLTFSDMLPNLDLITENTYQKAVGDTLFLNAYTFTELRIDPKMEFVDGQQYQWLRDLVPIPGTNQHYYELDQTLDVDKGSYHIEFTHPDVPNITLVRNPIIIALDDGDPPKPEFVKVISPNGDGINDSVEIKNIQFYLDHRVLIYDVLGRLIFSTTNYDNINNPFQGIGNVNGFGEVPDGTYYYLVDVGDPKKNGKGFFVMKR